MPVASLALNVTGTTPDTTPPPHSGPASPPRAGRLSSDSVTRAEYMLARTEWSGAPPGAAAAAGEDDPADDAEEQAARVQAGEVDRALIAGLRAGVARTEGGVDAALFEHRTARLYEA